MCMCRTKALRPPWSIYSPVTLPSHSRRRHRRSRTSYPATWAGSASIGTLRAIMAAGHPSVRFLAVTDRDPARAQKLAERTGAQFHSSDNLAAISHPQVNAVIVSTIEVAHTLPVMQALELGKPV